MVELPTDPSQGGTIDRIAVAKATQAAKRAAGGEQSITYTGDLDLLAKVSARLYSDTDSPERRNLDTFTAHLRAEQAAGTATSAPASTPTTKVESTPSESSTLTPIPTIQPEYGKGLTSRFNALRRPVTNGDDSERLTSAIPERISGTWRFDTAGRLPQELTDVGMDSRGFVVAAGYTEAVIGHYVTDAHTQEKWRIFEISGWRSKGFDVVLSNGKRTEYVRLDTFLADFNAGKNWLYVEPPTNKTPDTSPPPTTPPFTDGAAKPLPTAATELAEATPVAGMPEPEGPTPLAPDNNPELTPEEITMKLARAKHALTAGEYHTILEPLVQGNASPETWQELATNPRFNEATIHVFGYRQFNQILTALNMSEAEINNQLRRIDQIREQMKISDPVVNITYYQDADEQINLAFLLGERPPQETTTEPTNPEKPDLPQRPEPEPVTPAEPTTRPPALDDFTPTGSRFAKEYAETNGLLSPTELEATMKGITPLTYETYEELRKRTINKTAEEIDVILEGIPEYIPARVIADTKTKLNQILDHPLAKLTPEMVEASKKQIQALEDAANISNPDFYLVFYDLNDDNYGLVPLVRPKKDKGGSELPGPDESGGGPGGGDTDQEVNPPTEQPSEAAPTEAETNDNPSGVWNRVKSVMSLRRQPGTVREPKLKKGEAEHIDWVTNLVNLPHDPELKTKRDNLVTTDEINKFLDDPSDTGSAGQAPVSAPPAKEPALI